MRSSRKKCLRRAAFHRQFEYVGSNADAQAGSHSPSSIINLFRKQRQPISKLTIATIIECICTLECSAFIGLAAFLQTDREVYSTIAALVFNTQHTEINVFCRLSY